MNNKTGDQMIYYSVERSTDHLEHYGVKGMKWGVRKALQKGDSRALRRQYNKAVKKLAKLEKRGNSGSKYARRAAALTGAAGLTGSVAIGGTPLIAKGMRAASSARSQIARKLGQDIVPNSKTLLAGMDRATAVENFGKSRSLHKGANDLIDNIARKNKTGIIKKINESPIINKQAVSDMAKKNNVSIESFLKPKQIMKPEVQKKMFDEINALKKDSRFINSSPKYQEEWLNRTRSKYIDRKNFNTNKFAGNPDPAKAIAKSNIDKYNKEILKDSRANLTNDQLVRLGTAGVTAGLLGAAGYNAYRAATAKRNRAKAAEFRKAIQETFKGTEYAKYKGMPAPKKKKRR